MLRGALYLILQNPIYRGRIVHKENSYPGEHEAIVEEELWESVQRLLCDNRVDRKRGVGCKEPSLLGGILRDHTGGRMIPVNAVKKGRRYRYYVSQALIKNVREAAPESLRLAAEPVERAVGERLAAFLSDPASLHDAFGTGPADAREQRRLIEEGAALAAKWATLPVAERRTVLLAIQSRVIVGPNSIELNVDGVRLRALFLGEPLSALAATSTTETSKLIMLSTAFEVRPSGPDAKLVIEPQNGGKRREPDATLVRLLAQAHRYNAIFVRGGRSISDMAREVQVSRSYFTRVLRLSFLAPTITRAIVLGRQPATLCASTLARDTRIPVLWRDQLVEFGFA